MLGVQWVATNADTSLARAAVSVLSKLAVVVPEAERHLVDDPVLRTPKRRGQAKLAHDIVRLRGWCHQGWKVAIKYVDGADRKSERTVWPFLVGYHAGLQVLIAWCELRCGFRVFRLDRVQLLTFLDEPYPESPTVLRAGYFAQLQASDSADHGTA